MKKRAVIFDCDGTLVNVSGIRHYVRKPLRNFDQFHKASVYMPANDEVVAEARYWASQDVAVLVLTGRSERFRYVTATWLQKWDVAYTELVMRENGDQRPDYVVKREMLDRLRTEGYSILCAYDDNPNIIRLWEEQAIPVYEIPGWETADN